MNPLLQTSSFPPEKALPNPCVVVSVPRVLGGNVELNNCVPVIEKSCTLSSAERRGGIKK